MTTIRKKESLSQLNDVSFTGLTNNDIIRFNGSSWVNVPQATFFDALFNAKDTDDLSEGSTNLYFTNARADARISLASIGDLSDVDISGVTTGQVLKWNGTNFVPATDLNAPAGSNTYVQFNDSGVFGGDSGLTFNKTTDQLGINNIQFSLTPTTTPTGAGQVAWNSTDGTLDLGLATDVTMQIGQELPILVYNDTGVIIPNGSPVYIAGRHGHLPKVALARSDSETTADVIGLATQDIPATGAKTGYVTTFGYVRGIKTNYSGTGNWGTTWAENDNLYISKTVAGQLTNVQPSAPHHSDIVGKVAIVGSLGTGAIQVNIIYHKTVEELSDVDGTPINTTGQFLVWNQTNGYWDANYNITNYPTTSSLTFTQGSVLFAGATGLPAQDNSNFFYDDTNNRFGIGLSNPSEKLEVAGNIKTTSGNKYIGTTQNFIDINRYGFLNNTETNISFDGTDTFTLTDKGSGWSYYRGGIKYTISGNKTKVLATPMVNGTLYYIFIDATDGTLSSATSSWTLNDTKVPVATVFWNATLTPKYVMCDERHTCQIDRAYHREHHFSEGTEYVSGGVPSGYNLSSSTDADKVFGISACTIADEDLFLVASALTKPDGATPTFYNVYRTSTSAWAWEISDMPFKYASLGGGTYAYIEYDNGSGSSTASTNNRYVNTYLFVANVQGNNEVTPGTSTTGLRYFIIQGRGSYSTTALAYGETFSSFSLTGFPVAEGIAIYQFTWNTTGIANTVKGRCQLNRVQRITSNIISTSAVVATSHNSLAGLQGGTVDEYFHLTDTQHTDLTDGGDSTLHYHSADRAVSATTSVAGISELAIATEVTGGSDTTRTITPDALAGSTIFGAKIIEVQVVATATDVDTVSGIAYVNIPQALNGMELKRAQAYVDTAGTTNATTIQVRNMTKYSSNDALSGAISIASGGKVGTVGTVDTSYDDVATDDLIKIYVTGQSTTKPKGLRVCLEYQLP